MILLKTSLLLLTPPPQPNKLKRSVSNLHFCQPIGPPLRTGVLSHTAPLPPARVLSYLHTSGVFLTQNLHGSPTTHCTPPWTRLSGHAHPLTTSDRPHGSLLSSRTLPALPAPDVCCADPSACGTFHTHLRVLKSDVAPASC